MDGDVRFPKIKSVWNLRQVPIVRTRYSVIPFASAWYFSFDSLFSGKKLHSRFIHKHIKSCHSLHNFHTPWGMRNLKICSLLCQGYDIPTVFSPPWLSYLVLCQWLLQTRQGTRKCIVMTRSGFKNLRRKFEASTTNRLGHHAYLKWETIVTSTRTLNWKCSVVRFSYIYIWWYARLISVTFSSLIEEAIMPYRWFKYQNGNV